MAVQLDIRDSVLRAALLEQPALTEAPDGVMLADDADGTLRLVEGGEDRQRFAAPIRLGAVLAALQAIGGTLSEPRIALGEGVFDRARGCLEKDGTVITLTDREAALLSHLLMQRGAAVSRETLLDAVWGFAAGVSTHTVASHIWRLRQKLEDAGLDPALIETVPDGYRAMGRR